MGNLGMPGFVHDWGSAPGCSWTTACAQEKSIRLPKRKCCMMGTLDSTSTWYIFIMPEFTYAQANSLYHFLSVVYSPSSHDVLHECFPSLQIHSQPHLAYQGIPIVWQSTCMLQSPGIDSQESAIHAACVQQHTLLHVGTPLMSFSIGEVSARGPFFTCNILAASLNSQSHFWAVRCSFCAAKSCNRTVPSAGPESG